MLFITKETALCTDPNRICCICGEGAQADERSSPLHLPLSRFRFSDTDHVRWPLRERCKLMLNGLLSDRRKLQTGNEKGENAPTNAQRSAIIQRRHAEGERRGAGNRRWLRFGVASVGGSRLLAGWGIGGVL